MIRGGEQQSRITVTAQTLVDRPDGGQDVITSVVLDAVPASVRPVAADEMLRQTAQYAVATHRARLRMPRTDAGAVVPLSPAMLADAISGYTGQRQTFTITAVQDPDGRGRELELLLEERVT